MATIWMGAIIAVIAAVVFILLRSSKKPSIPKPGEVQQNVQYHKRYPKRSEILQKNYLMEEDAKKDQRLGE